MFGDSFTEISAEVVLPHLTDSFFETVKSQLISILNRINITFNDEIFSNSVRATLPKAIYLNIEGESEIYREKVLFGTSGDVDGVVRGYVDEIMLNYFILWLNEETKTDLPFLLWILAKQLSNYNTVSSDLDEIDLLLERVFPLQTYGEYDIPYYVDILKNPQQLSSHIEKVHDHIIGNRFYMKFNCKENSHEFDPAVSLLEGITDIYKGTLSSYISKGWDLEGKTPIIQPIRPQPTILVDCPIAHYSKNPDKKWNGLVEQLEVLSNKKLEDLKENSENFNNEFLCEDFDYDWENNEVKIKDVMITDDTVSLLISCTTSNADAYLIYPRDKLRIHEIAPQSWD